MTNRCQLLCGDVIEQLQTLPDESVHCVVTSPPYYAARDYGTGTWEGGDPGCDHHAGPKRQQAGFNERYSGVEPMDTDKQSELTIPFKGTCGKCGATRRDRQIGLEDSVDAYVGRLVDVFREVRRVLRPEGTLWLNLGDTYAGGNYRGNSPSTVTGKQRSNAGTASLMGKKMAIPENFKPKDLMGMPWRVALALQQDGWYLRSDIIWAKPNPMPCSVTDRPTLAHEYIFLLSKQKNYYYDMTAVREPTSESMRRQVDQGYRGKAVKRYQGTGAQDPSAVKARIIRNAKANGTQETRNQRSVWTFPSQPFRGAHFATFPKVIPDRAIRAATSSEGCCPACGAPMVRVLKKKHYGDWEKNPEQRLTSGTATVDPCSLGAAAGGYVAPEHQGWEPTCRHHGFEPVPCVVLDPFMGSGTTALVALELGRHAIGIDLNPEYVEISKKRTADVAAQPRIPMNPELLESAPAYTEPFAGRRRPAKNPDQLSLFKSES